MDFRPLQPLRDLRRLNFERRCKQQIRRSMRDEAGYFAAGVALPKGYGRGMNERAVEFGWALAHNPAGEVLDAGSTFNHPYTLDALLPRVEALTIVTLAPEANSYPERGVKYLYEDLRSLSFADDAFDRVLCLSVLEHVGLDTSGYGFEADAVPDPQAEAVAAMRELARVTRPGGELLVSVPFGESENHQWVRNVNEAELHELIEAAAPSEWHLSVYRDSDSGWRAVKSAEAASASYRGYKAEAVACVQLKL